MNQYSDFDVINNALTQGRMESTGSTALDILKSVAVGGSYAMILVTSVLAMTVGLVDTKSAFVNHDGANSLIGSGLFIAGLVGTLFSASKLTRIDETNTHRPYLAVMAAICVIAASLASAANSETVHNLASSDMRIEDSLVRDIPTLTHVFRR